MIARGSRKKTVANTSAVSSSTCRAKARNGVLWSNSSRTPVVMRNEVRLNGAKLATPTHVSGLPKMNSAPLSRTNAPPAGITSHKAMKRPILVPKGTLLNFCSTRM